MRRAHEGRILAIDVDVTDAWAALNAHRPLPLIDSLQAATALVHGLTFVTRNVGDLDGVDIPVHNPFAQAL